MRRTAVKPVSVMPGLTRRRSNLTSSLSIVVGKIATIDEARVHAETDRGSENVGTPTEYQRFLSRSADKSRKMGV
jgi:hypothetical protein